MKYYAKMLTPRTKDNYLSSLGRSTEVRLGDKCQNFKLWCLKQKCYLTFINENQHIVIEESSPRHVRASLLLVRLSDNYLVRRGLICKSFSMCEMLFKYCN